MFHALDRDDARRLRHWATYWRDLATLVGDESAAHRVGEYLAIADR